MISPTVRVDCPYCSKTQFVSPTQHFEHFVRECDTEDGGCGRLLVVTTRVRVDVETLKVEEAEPNG